MHNRCQSLQVPKLTMPNGKRAAAVRPSSSLEASADDMPALIMPHGKQVIAHRCSLPVALTILLLGLARSGCTDLPARSSLSRPYIPGIPPWPDALSEVSASCSLPSFLSARDVRCHCCLSRPALSGLRGWEQVPESR